VLIWTAERPERDALVLPDPVEAALVPRQPSDHPDLGRVEVFVPPYRSQKTIDALPGACSSATRSSALLDERALANVVARDDASR
jgi:hypothetical protein